MEVTDMSLVEVRVLSKGPDLMLLGLDWEERTLLKAKLPLRSEHPRAAITVLEGLALWSGHKLPVVIGVDAKCTGWIGDLLPEGPAWCSPLVDLHPVDWPRRRRRGPRLDGVGDFRNVHQLRLPVALP
jgi:hypothetical protein